jgi:hypothetical protein
LFSSEHLIFGHIYSIFLLWIGQKQQNLLLLNRDILIALEQPRHAGRLPRQQISDVI